MLAGALRGVADDLGFEPSDEQVAEFAGSVGDWPAFEDSAEALAALKRRFRLGVITNCDDDLFALSNRTPRRRLRLGRHRPAGRAATSRARSNFTSSRSRASARRRERDPARRPEPLPRPRAGQGSSVIDHGVGRPPPRPAPAAGATFDADLRISAFELLYRAVGEEGLPLHPSKATATVLVAALTDVGLDRLVGDQRAFINVNREFLLSFRPLPLPADRVVLELVEDQIMDADLMDVLGELVTVGFTLALDNFSYRPEYEPLLRLARSPAQRAGADAEELAQHVRRLRDWDLQIIAEKVETREQLDYCRQLGIDGFQGYFFAARR